MTLKTRKHLQPFLGFTLAIVLSVIAGAQAATTWYVATNGSDSGNSGALDQPFLSISNALFHATEGEGDTIPVSDGVYEITATISNPAAKACRIRAWSTNPANTALLGPGSNDVTNFRGVGMAGAGSLLQGGIFTPFVDCGDLTLRSSLNTFVKA